MENVKGNGNQLSTSKAFCRGHNEHLMYKQKLNLPSSMFRIAVLDKYTS